MTDRGSERHAREQESQSRIMQSGFSDLIRSAPRDGTCCVCVLDSGRQMRGFLVLLRSALPRLYGFLFSLEAAPPEWGVGQVTRFDDGAF